VLLINKRHLPSTTLVSASWWPERPGGRSPCRSWTRSPHLWRQHRLLPLAYPQKTPLFNYYIVFKGIVLSSLRRVKLAWEPNAYPAAHSLGLLKGQWNKMGQKSSEVVIKTGRLLAS